MSIRSLDKAMNFKQVCYLDLRAISRRAVAEVARDPLYRNSFFMAFTNIFNAGCGFFFWMIAARLYTVEQVGLATALISALGLVLLFSRLGFDFSVIRFFASTDKGMVVGTSLIVTTAACILTGLAYIMLAVLVTPSMLFLREPGFALAFLLIGTVYSVTAVTGNAFIAGRKADHYFLQNLFMALRIPILLPLAFLGVFGIFGAVGMGFLIASLFGLLIMQRDVNFQPIVDWKFIRSSFRFSAWNYVSSIFAAAPTLILPIMILNMLGEADAAKYYMAFTIGNLVLIIPSSLSLSLFVEGSHGEGLRNSVFRAGGTSLALLVPVVLFLFLIGDKLLGLLGGEYVEAFELLRIIALSSFPLAAYSLFMPIQNVRLKAKSLVGLNVLRCMLLLGLSYLLVQRYGILGAGYAWMATYVVIALGAGWVVWRESGYEI